MIKNLRKEGGVTQRWLAGKVGVSRQTLSSWENGKAIPEPENLKKLEEVFREKFPEQALPPVSTGEEKASVPAYKNRMVEHRVVTVPLITIPARASFLEMSGKQQEYGMFQTEGIVPQDGEDLSDCICLVVDGDSMEPQLQSGMKVLAKPVNQANWAYMNGAVYAISYAEFFVIKRVKNNNISEGFLRLHSDNEKGGTFDIPVDQIRRIWRIVRIVDAPVH